MSRSSSSKLVRFLAAAAIAAGAAAPATGESISIRADPWLPYSGAGRNPPAGYMIDAARSIARANGHTIDYANMPWADALEAVRAGTFDCVVGAARDDAEDFMFPAVSWGKSQNAFFTLADSKWRYTGIDSLADVRLVVIDGYSYSEELDAYVEAHRDDGKLVVVSSVGRAAINAVSKLVTDKADVFVENVNVMRQTLAALQMTDRIVDRGSLDEITDVYIACTPATPRGRMLADLFSEGLKKLRASGELKQILDRYGLADW
jgi:polar amino acid transport system substrate-binding protein